METKRTCSDCGVEPGSFHVPGCDVERCPACGGQAISCACSGVEEERLPWTGRWPGAEAAEGFGLWCYWGDRETGEYIESIFSGQVGSWLPCAADHPGARPDLNRLHELARWDRKARAWVLLGGERRE